MTMRGIPDAMRAVAIDRFGGIDELELRTLPVPQPEPGEVLIRLEYAGVGEWDPFEREGGYAAMQGTDPRFPYVLGSEGSGTVAAVGERVTHLREGDRVCAVGFLNPRGGFYAEYAVVDAALVRPVPQGMSMAQAGAMSGVALTALRGLEDTLALRPGETVVVFGASGGVGHMAVQLARRMGARVMAVASGPDGVELATRLGADAAVDGRNEDAGSAVNAFAPSGADTVLLTAGGDAADRVLERLRPGGRAAYPNGIQPEPRVGSGVRIEGYNGGPDADIIERLHRWITSGPLEVHIARTFRLHEAASAHKTLQQHYLGKLVLHIA
jgi:NADPH:quinone reductase